MDDHIYPEDHNNLYFQQLFYSIAHQGLNPRMD